MTWNPPPTFSTGDVPTLAEWNRYITTLDALQIRYRPETNVFATQHNCFARYVASGTAQTSHTVPLPVTPANASFVGVFVFVLATNFIDVRVERFLFTNFSASTTYNFTSITLTFSISSSGVFTISADQPIRYAGYSIVIQP